MASSLAKGAVSGLSGAASGAGIGTMLLPGIGTAIGAGLGGLFGVLGGGGDDDEQLKEQQAAAAAERKRLKDAQYGFIEGMKAPTQTASMQARIQALKDQSQPTALVEDPYFQAQRAQLVQGGQQALAGVQNMDRGHGIQGGFANVGGANDIYDRLSGQLAQLGQDSANLKDSKATQAAQMEQNYQNAVAAFQNAQQQAKMAIEAGDSAAAMDAINVAYEAKKQIAANDSKMVSSALGGLASLAGGLGGAGGLSSLLGGGDMASLTSSIGTLGDLNKSQMPSMPSLGQKGSGGGVDTGMGSVPWSAMRR